MQTRSATPPGRQTRVCDATWPPMRRADRGRCSIYPVRPRTCRVYDCRVFPAAGVEPDKPVIAERAQRWEFEHLDPQDRIQHEAVQAAVRYLRAHREGLPPDAVPAHPTQLAVLAVRVRHLFLSTDSRKDQPRLVEPDIEHVQAVLTRLGVR